MVPCRLILVSPGVYIYVLVYYSITHRSLTCLLRPCSLLICSALAHSPATAPCSLTHLPSLHVCSLTCRSTLPDSPTAAPRYPCDPITIVPWRNRGLKTNRNIRSVVCKQHADSPCIAPIYGSFLGNSAVCISLFGPVQYVQSGRQ